MTEATYKKKLIEVALPLDAINREAAREKSIRHGHPSTLHLWWARRPLAACRAVLFAQLVDDPSAHPDEFPTEELQEKERLRLFGIIERLVKWENSNNETVLEEARAEIRKSCEGDPPPVLDPFAGGGSIPLEAQRLGLKAYASDLNPVAVLINKALIEIPPRWAGRPPVHPRDDGRLDTQTWQGAQGLAEDVRYYGQWMRDEVERRIGHLYPKATLSDGSKATVIAWIWARTVACPNPACGAQAPLVRSFWLGKKKGKEAWVRAVVREGEVTFSVEQDSSGPAVEGTVSRVGATCVACGEHIPLTHVRAEGRSGRIGSQLMAVAAEGDRRRHYLTPGPKDASAAEIAESTDLPLSPIRDVALGFRVQNYGLRNHGDLFSPRQSLMLVTLQGIAAEARTRVAQDAALRGVDDPAAYAADLLTYLALAIGRLASRSSNLCFWLNQPKNEGIGNAFGGQTLSMTWDWAEANPFSASSGNLGDVVRSVADVVERLPAGGQSLVQQRSADRLGGSEIAVARPVVSTDPPYYANVGYSDLADIFYFWLRPVLRDVDPDLFATLQGPKEDELVADPAQHGGEANAREFFQDGFVRVFSGVHGFSPSEFPIAVYYSYKQEEGTAEDRASTGWETLLEGLVGSGYVITATWPVRTERPGRMRSNKSNALASSIVLACRPRPAAAGITDRRGFLEALRHELPQALREMQQGHVAPVDLAQASIGPGIGVYSRYSRVLEPSGDSLGVRAALGLINQVLDEVLAEQEGDFDAETRWAIKWFSQYGFDEGPFGDAETLCKATGTAINGMQRSGIVGSKSSKVWLVGREDLPADWDPASDDRVPVWEATQQLVKALDEGGETATADLLARLGGVGETARELAYRLYAICDQKKWAKEAGAYNALVTSWPEIRRKAAEGPSGQGSLL